MKKLVISSLIILVSVFVSPAVYAGVPLNNLEGVGGVAFNPLAYPSNPGTSLDNDPNSPSFWKNVGKPQIGSWYVHLGQPHIDWGSISVSDTFFKRLEVSYGHEIIGVKGLDTIHKDNLGLKFLLIEEGDIVPAVSFGTVFKQTSFDSPGVDKSGADYYLVGTKLIKALPLPVLLSGGVLSTQGRVLGVLGFDDGIREVLFGNVDIIPMENVALGFEYRQGSHYGDWKDSDYWNAHVAWFVNKNLTLVGAYVNAGKYGSTSKVGLGDGVVFSLQYAF